MHEDCDSCEEFALHNKSHTKDNVKKKRVMFVAVGNDIQTDQQNRAKITEMMVIRRNKYRYV